MAGLVAETVDGPFFGQSIAFAKSADPDDTTFAVQSLTFGAFVPQAGKYNSMDPLEPRFFPIVRTAQIDVPALQAIARTTAPAGVVYAAPIPPERVPHRQRR